jgi:ParB family transcriptional regulator, chromosome partitioning protein
MTKAKRSGLGKGLSALLSSESIELTEKGDFKALGEVAVIPISQIEANPFQPRTEFEAQALNELAESIKIHGIIQPITLRKMGYEKYQLISGERRTRAAILAGLNALPAYVRLANDQDMLEMALIENIQRENLNAVEIALSYKRLMEECDLKQDELGERVGKDRSTVANYVRLLKLPDEIQAAIKNTEISMGHARCIAGLKSPEEQLELYQIISSEGLSVRATEQLIKQNAQHAKPTKKSTDKTQFASQYSEIFETFKPKINSKISLKTGANNRAQLVINIQNEAELQEILSKLE